VPAIALTVASARSSASLARSPFPGSALIAASSGRRAIRKVVLIALLGIT
jgi:hypothetical protein